jgi:hypothetical protein
MQCWFRRILSKNGPCTWQCKKLTQNSSSCFEDTLSVAKRFLATIQNEGYGSYLKLKNDKSVGRTCVTKDWLVSWAGRSERLLSHRHSRPWPCRVVVLVGVSPYSPWTGEVKGVDTLSYPSVTLPNDSIVVGVDHVGYTNLTVVKGVSSRRRHMLFWQYAWLGKKERQSFGAQSCISQSEIDTSELICNTSNSVSLW